MKILFFLIFCCAAFTTQAQTETTAPAIHRAPKVQVVETACGECQFKMKGKGCNLAVRIDGKPYFVDGTTIDEHGDAHSPDGFCNAVRKAEVTGTVVKDRFVATSFRLLPAEKKTP